MSEVNKLQLHTGRILTLKEACRQVQDDTSRIKKVMRMGSPFIDSIEKINEIEGVAADLLIRKERMYAYYEIGNSFIVEHLTEICRKEVGLGQRETNLLKAALGRLDYNPPVSEYKRRSDAAMDLSGSNSAAGILNSLKDGIGGLMTIWNTGRANSDMFGNPLIDIKLRFSDAKNFRQVAASEKKMMNLLLTKPLESRSFYV